MAGRGIEMAVGARRDPQWGPVLMVGLGGIWIETLGDVRLMPADLDADAIAAEIGKLRGAKMLHGARGMAPADVAGAGARGGARRRVAPRNPDTARDRRQPAAGFPQGKGVLALDALIVTD